MAPPRPVHHRALGPLDPGPATRNGGVRWSFVDIVGGCLGERRWDWIVASFTLHLAPPSLLPALGWELARHAPRLLVVTPHKRPALEPHHGWALDAEHLDRASRVRGRVYRSLAGA